MILKLMKHKKISNLTLGQQDEDQTPNPFLSSSPLPDDTYLVHYVMFLKGEFG